MLSHSLQPICVNRWIQPHLYLVLQKIKLKPGDMLPFQFKRKNIFLSAFKGSPSGRKEWSKIWSGFTHKAEHSRTV